MNQRRVKKCHPELCGKRNFRIFTLHSNEQNRAPCPIPLLQISHKENGVRHPISLCVCCERLLMNRTVAPLIM